MKKFILSMILVLSASSVLANPPVVIPAPVVVRPPRPIVVRPPQFVRQYPYYQRYYVQPLVQQYQYIQVVPAPVVVQPETIVLQEDYQPEQVQRVIVQGQQYERIVVRGQHYQRPLPQVEVHGPRTYIRVR